MSLRLADPMSELRRRAVAHHEAGHSVAALVLGATVDHVTIDPARLRGSGWDGVTWFTAPQDPNQQAMITLAGPVSEEMFLHSISTVTPTPDGGMFVYGPQLPPTACAERERALLVDPAGRAEMVLRVLALLAEHEEQVACVAHALLEQGTLTGDDLPGPGAEVHR
jgi:hypothetical protein